MTDQIETLNLVCHCGHHKDTHYSDQDGPGDCLGIGCNVGEGTECKRFRDRSKHDPLTEPRIPKHAEWCQCFDCKRYDTWACEKYGPIQGPSLRQWKQYRLRTG